ncbi:unnamed protein product, partial [Meganyctiphanes norvegica]
MKQEVTGHFSFNENHYQLYIGRGIQSLSSTGRRTVTSYIGELAILSNGGTHDAFMRVLDATGEDVELMLGFKKILIYEQTLARSKNTEKYRFFEPDHLARQESWLFYAILILFLELYIEHKTNFVTVLNLEIYIDLSGLTLSRGVEGYIAKGCVVRRGLNSFSSLQRLKKVKSKIKYFKYYNIYISNNCNIFPVALTFPILYKLLDYLIKTKLAKNIDLMNHMLRADIRNLQTSPLLKHWIYGICRPPLLSRTFYALWILYNANDGVEFLSMCTNIFLYSVQGIICWRWFNNHICHNHQFLMVHATVCKIEAIKYLTVISNQESLKPRYCESLRHNHHPLQLESLGQLTSIISCQLLDGQVEVAEQQLEFLKEVQRSLGGSPDILYLSAVLARMKHQPTETILGLLNEAIENHFKNHRGMSFGATYLAALNPDFLLLIVNECLLYAPNQPDDGGGGTSSGVVPPVVKRSLLVLEAITRACPALLPALVLAANTKFITGDVKGASAILHHILEDIDSTSSEAHLLMAQIQLHQGNYKQAQQSLEVGLSYNFEVREQPTYHLVRARVLKKQGQYEEAIKTLKACLNISNTRPTTTKGSRNKAEMTLPDRVSVFLELCDCYRLNNNPTEASNVMNQAMTEFQGTGEEVRLNIASADLALMRGETDHALAMLRAIGPEQTYYMQARDKMASIYLNHLKDKRMFASCYREVVEKNPTPQSFLLLGDAYMSIQEPDRAIEVYEQALKRNPRDSQLACRMGQALVKTHQYGKAINYYKDAIKSGNSNQLRYDMAELQMRLKQYDKSEKTISMALESESLNPTDLASMCMQAKLLNLLAKVHERNENYENALTTLSKAKEVQVKVLKRSQVELPDTIPEQKQLAASMCSQMAEHAANQREHERSIQLYKEALQYDPENATIMLALAKLYMQINDLDQCQYTCMSLLRTDKENDSATVMMADLSYRRNEYDTAMFHFQQLLERRPAYFPALARLVEVMRRTGTLDETAPYLDRSEQATLRPTTDPGYNFCRGLYEWYMGNPNSSLKYFNKARKDEEWGQRAVYNMIEICLNPDNDTIGGETFESVDGEVNQLGTRDTLDMAIRTADKLLKELKPKPGDQMVSHQILGGFLLLATKQKSHAERALNDFMGIAAQEAYKDHVGAILGMATAYMIVKQTPRARNQLKRLTKAVWNFEDAEYLERCWLLLADIYVQTGKYDMATDLLKRVLQHNRSCMKAYEYMGFIMEKEQSYRDAAYNYEQAWKFSGNTNPMIGYKLAFNYMKAKRYVDAIDVCHLVLEKHPEYPRIRKDILEKSRNSLRL